MANKLKIYACSGIGEVADKKEYTYWLDNTSTIHNTQAVNNLLSIINLNYSEIEYISGLTDEEIIQRLNTIDLMCVCLEAAQNYGSHYTKLGRAGKVISRMIEDGLFENDKIDNKERDARLDSLLGIFRERMEADEQYTDNTEFDEWWYENVVKLNTIGLSEREQQHITETLHDAISGIGAGNWQDDKDISKYLNDAGSYFLYTYFAAEQLAKLPRVFTTKKKQQDYIYNYCKGIFVKMYGTEEAMRRIIRSGIMRDYSEEPEIICDDIATKGEESKYYKGIGDGGAAAGTVMVGAITLEAFLSIMTIVSGIVIGIVQAICDCVARQKEAQYAAVDRVAIDGGVPNPEDYAGMNWSNSGSGILSKSSILPIAAIGAALLLLLKR